MLRRIKGDCNIEDLFLTECAPGYSQFVIWGNTLFNCWSWHTASIGHGHTANDEDQRRLRIFFDEVCTWLRPILQFGQIHLTIVDHDTHHLLGTHPMMRIKEDWGISLTKCAPGSIPIWIAWCAAIWLILKHHFPFIKRKSQESSPETEIWSFINWRKKYRGPHFTL